MFRPAPAPAPLECLGCQKRFYTASPDALVRDGARCNCGSALIHAGVDALIAVAA
jgi:hypothetical protein